MSAGISAKSWRRRIGTRARGAGTARREQTARPRLRTRISRGVTLLAVTTVALPLAVVGVNSASATNHTTFGPYNIEGTVADTIAGSAIPDPSGSVKELGPLNGSTTKIGNIHDDAVPTLGLTNPNAQVDLNRTWLDLRRHTDGKDYLYFAWQRDSNSGSGFIAYEFMQSAAPSACVYGTPLDTAALIANCNPFANRQAGDFMITWDQQGGNRVLKLRRWTDTGSGLTLGALEDLDQYSHADYSSDFFQGEAAVDLTGAGLAGSGSCLTISNTVPSTVTGNSDTADYKDTVLTRKELTTCGRVSFVKEDDLGQPLQGAWFTLFTGTSTTAYTKSTTLPADTTSGTTLTVADASGFPSTGSFEVNVAGQNPALTVTSRSGNVLTLSAAAGPFDEGATVAWNGTCSPSGTTTASCALPNLPFGTYTLRETDAPDGYNPAADKTFVISASDLSAGGSGMPHTFTNSRAPIDITVNKKDDSATPVALPDAVFGLYEDNVTVAAGSGSTITGFLPVKAAASPTSTTLNGGVTSSATSLVVTSATGLAGAPFWLRLGSGSGAEDVKVTAVAGTTLTVARGQQLTTPAAWSSGTSVERLDGNDPLVKRCTTGSLGSCTLDTVMPDAYVLDEITPPTGYAKTTDLPAPVVVNVGDENRTLPETTTGYYVDPRLFKVITVVCRAATASTTATLYGSEVTYSGTGAPAGVLKSLNTGAALPGSLTESQLCGLGGAAMPDVQKGTYGASTVIKTSPVTTP